MNTVLFYVSLFYFVFGINFWIYFISLASLVSIHLLIYLLSHLRHYHHSQLPFLC